jgi:hypothetical protein
MAPFLCPGCDGKEKKPWFCLHSSLHTHTGSSHAIANCYAAEKAEWVDQCCAVPFAQSSSPAAAKQKLMQPGYDRGKCFTVGDSTATAIIAEQRTW